MRPPPARGPRLAQRLAAAALGAALCAGCSDTDLNPLPTVGSDDGDPVVAQPSFARDVQPIFTARCAVAGCHITPTEANLGLVLTDAATSYAHLVNVPSGEVTGGVLRVLPGSAIMSWLMVKLDTGEMPKEGAMLSQGTRDTIRNWIDQGAQNN
ncbi:MAG TPA: hypothetical protein VFD06_01605 [Candidatus Polarisedimenticolia bacterium]|nr:hypothetical protein [Candidatus Polarisedimenticolia bacterium]